MSRGGTIYISTNPNVTLAIGTPGVSTSIGPLGPMIYAPAMTGNFLNTEDGFFLITEDTGAFLTTEN